MVSASESLSTALLSTGGDVSGFVEPTIRMSLVY
jgi:hypothetical protein